MNQRNNHSDTKKTIFMVAAHLFAKKGFNGVSMREISEKSGVSKPMIYYYFENKEGIYKQLLETGLEHGEQIFKKIFDSDISFREKLKVIMEKRLLLTQKYPDFSRFFLLLTSATSKLPVFEEFDGRIQRQRQMFKRLIEEGIKSGEFGPRVNPQIAIDILGAVMVYYVRKFLDTQNTELPEKTSGEVIDLLFRGLNE